MALLYNFKEMSFTLEVLVQDDIDQIDFLTSRYSDVISYGNTSSPNAVSLKVQIDALKSKVANNKRQIASLDAQSKKTLAKCTETTVEMLQTSKNRKSCSSNEKKAISSVIASFRSVQDKKQKWDGKKRVAEAWMNDLAKPSSIRATAMSDFRTYSRYYEIEEVKESFVVSQFEFLNAGCRNSGLYLPKAFTPPTPKPQPDPNTGVYLDDWRFSYNSLKGGFTSEQQSDGSMKIQCKNGNGANTKWGFPTGLNLEGAKLLLTGTRGSDSNYSQFTLNSFRVKDFLVPVERVKVLGAKMGYQDDYATFQDEIAGKSIGFSSNGSICGLTTEVIGNLKQTFASDVKTAGLILLIRTDRNPGRVWPPGNQLAILIGSFTSSVQDLGSEVYLEDWRAEYNPITGGFTSELKSDGSILIQCKDGQQSNSTTFEFPKGISLEGSKLILTGNPYPNNASNYGTFLLSSYRVQKFLFKADLIKVLGARTGSQTDFDKYDRYEIAGKSIGFSSNGSICGLTTEVIGNLKQTFASDVKTAGLILLIRTDRNPGRVWPPGNQLAILIGSFEVK